MLKYIVMIVMIQLFYGFGMTLLAYALPTAAIDMINMYSGPSEDLDMVGISDTIESNLRSQLDIPIVDIGAVVFFSGNILMDLIINFFTAIPSMITLAFTSFFMLFPVDAFIATQIKIVVWVFASIVYFIAFLSFIMSIRSGTGGIV